MKTDLSTEGAMVFQPAATPQESWHKQNKPQRGGTSTMVTRYFAPMVLDDLCHVIPLAMPQAKLRCAFGAARFSNGLIVKIRRFQLLFIRFVPKIRALRTLDE